MAIGPGRSRRRAKTTTTNGHPGTIVRIIPTNRTTRTTTTTTTRATRATKAAQTAKAAAAAVLRLKTAAKEHPRHVARAMWTVWSAATTIVLDRTCLVIRTRIRTKHPRHRPRTGATAAPAAKNPNGVAFPRRVRQATIGLRKAVTTKKVGGEGTPIWKQHWRVVLLPVAATNVPPPLLRHPTIDDVVPAVRVPRPAVVLVPTTATLTGKVPPKKNVPPPPPAVVLVVRTKKKYVS